MKVKKVVIGFISSVNDDWVDISKDTQAKINELDNQEEYLYNDYDWFARDPNGKLWRSPVKPEFNEKVNEFKFYAYKQFTEFEIPEITFINSPVVLISEKESSTVKRNIFKYDIPNQETYHITDGDNSDLGVTQRPIYNPDFDNQREILIHSYELPSFLNKEVVKIIDEYAVDLVKVELYFTMPYDEDNQVMTFKLDNHLNQQFYFRNDFRFSLSRVLSLETLMSSTDPTLLVKTILDSMIKIINDSKK